MKCDLKSSFLANKHKPGKSRNTAALSVGNVFPDSQRLPEILGGPEPCSGLDATHTLHCRGPLFPTRVFGLKYQSAEAEKPWTGAGS